MAMNNTGYASALVIERSNWVTAQAGRKLGMTYPDAVTEVATYYESDGTTVAMVVTTVYVDSTKAKILSVTRTS